MTYDLIITLTHWITQECANPIKSIGGFYYIVEAIANPGKSVKLFQIFMIHNFIPKKVIGYRDFDRFLDSDYLSQSYQEALQEKINCYHLMEILSQYKQKVLEKEDNCSFCEMELYQERCAKVELLLRKHLHISNNVDDFISITNHNVCCLIEGAMLKLKKYAPQLYEHLNKCLAIGYNICYNPELDDDFDLIIRER